MSERVVTNKLELMAAIGEEWAALTTALSRLSSADFTAHRDAHGWTVKDHLAHLAAWERSVLFLLTGRPRHLGLGVSEQLYLTRGEDAINDAIAQQNKKLSAGETLEQLNSVHAQMADLLTTLDDAALHKRYRAYLPDEPGDGDGPVVLDVIFSNTANHYAEHLPWILAIAAGQA